jgi:hypothetical protein
MQKSLLTCSIKFCGYGVQKCILLLCKKSFSRRHNPFLEIYVFTIQPCFTYLYTLLRYVTIFPLLNFILSRYSIFSAGCVLSAKYH